MILITLLSALFISAIAAWFSIAGLISIFPGAPVAVGLMGAALELAKLVSASWIYRFWKQANKFMRIYFIAAVMVLSFITSIGIFGYLTKSHIEGIEGLSSNSDQIALIDEQIINERNTIEMSRTALQQMDAAVNNLVGDVNRVERAVQIRNNQRRERTSLMDAITASNKKIQEFQAQKLDMSVDQRKLETEVGPIKYVAQLIYSKDDAATIDKAVRLLTLMLIFVFDPLAILLVIAANLTQKAQTPTNPPAATPMQTDWSPSSITKMETDWNPGSWFKIVKNPLAK